MKSILSNILFAIIMMIVSQLYFYIYDWVIYYPLISAIDWFHAKDLFDKSMIITFMGIFFVVFLVGSIMTFVVVFMPLSEFIFKRFSKNLFTKIFSILIFIANGGFSILIILNKMNYSNTFMVTLEFILVALIILAINFSFVLAGYPDKRNIEL